MAPLSSGFGYPRPCHGSVPQPQRACSLVWASARSLATTCAIAFAFFSSWYCDVSLPTVSPRADYLIHPQVVPYERYWVPPFGNPRIKALWRLPGAYRSLMRPSSPHDAKASVVRPYTLSKKSRYLVTLQFSLTLSSSVFKDLRRAPQGDSPCAAQRVSNIPKRPLRRKGVREDFRKFFSRGRETP